MKKKKKIIMDEGEWKYVIGGIIFYLFVFAGVIFFFASLR
jgi:hypothetical protein